MGIELPRTFIEKTRSWRPPSIDARYKPTRGEQVLSVLAVFGQASLVTACMYGAVSVEHYLQAEQWRREYKNLKRLERSRIRKNL